ncbi:hypothetical protein FOZ62_004748 [Perkinsus olseni]|uniref:Uncharacterized protein n=1 Tax=Perkinsus olseni TaxID=32597 RepID=A0A7J6UA28_PEROL|nr:hypothetical protein FOZ62_004748 [Perkinsus olseni]
MLFLPLPSRGLSNQQAEAPGQSGSLSKRNDDPSYLRLPIPACAPTNSSPMDIGLSPEGLSDPSPKDEEGWLRRASLNAVRNQRICSSMSADTTVRHSATGHLESDYRDGLSRSVSFDGNKEISFYHISSPIGVVLHTKIPTKTFDGCSDLDSTRGGSVREFGCINDLLSFAQRMSYPPAETIGNRKIAGAVDSVASGSVGSPVYADRSSSGCELYRPMRKLRPARFGFEEESVMNTIG